MISLITLDEVIRDYPIVDKWLDIIYENILCKPERDTDILSFYTFSFYVKKSDQVDTQDMTFNERFKYEMSKVRVNVNLKVKDLIFVNRLPVDSDIPKDIKNMVYEITKFKMIVESVIQDNKNFSTIPGIEDYSELINFLKTLKSDLETNGEVENKSTYDLDEILDKISLSGIKSLNKSELDFLHSRSNE